ncbi:MAG: hypothetical protein ACK55Z_32880 [bacterium]
MANPIKVVKAIGRAVGGITGKGSKNVNPVYKEMGRTNQIQSNSVKVKRTQKQMDEYMYAENDKALKSWSEQVSKQMWDNMSSGEDFSKVKKINSNPMRGK